MYLQAAAGDVEGVESGLQAMADAGLRPGPAAFHTLILAHLKSGWVSGALEAATKVEELGELIR